MKRVLHRERRLAATHTGNGAFRRDPAGGVICCSQG